MLMPLAWSLTPAWALTGVVSGLLVGVLTTSLAREPAPEHRPQGRRAAPA